MAFGRCTFRRISRILGVATVAALLYLGLTYKPQFSSTNTGAARYQSVIPHLEVGDLVFRYGNGQWSKYFRDMSEREKRFSHVGVVVGGQSEFAVVHSSADDWTGIGSVRREPLKSFIDGIDDFVVYRVKCTDAERREIADTALAYVGKPFDARFDLSTSSRIYCTELVRIAVNGVLKEEAVTTTNIKGKVFVAIDDCYLGSRFVKVYDRIQDTEKGNTPD